MPDTYTDALAWMLDRVGKRVFRPSFGCECMSCKAVVKMGLNVADREHAAYMAESALELGYRYADTAEEVIHTN
jgi:predicted aldo/keto reductase-like oxidoreductase